MNPSPLAHPGSQDLNRFILDHFAERSVRPEGVIAQSWHRSIVQHGLNPRGRNEKVILTAAEIRRHQELNQEYLAIAGQGVTGLSKRVAQAGFAVLLSDENGITLDSRLPAQRDPYTQSGLIIGARWDESVVGTNGIGTSLVSQRALTIHREEHFLAANARMSCSVSPIFDPLGKLKGCLNASCLDMDGPKEAQHLTLQLVVMYARMIENAYFRHSYRDCLTLALKPRDEISDLASEQLLALDEGGNVVGANHAAFVAHQKGRQLIGRAIDSLLPLRVDELLGLSNGGARSLMLRTLDEEALIEVALRIPAGAPAATRPVGSYVAPNGEPNRSKPASPDLEQLSGRDAGLQASVQRLRKLLDKGLPILLEGETGTGKEAFARAIHAASRRARGPFVALNCAAIPETLIESELFGYRSGSFTGANRKGMKGKLELANGGTLFLDEIGDMPAHLQTRLLRVLAEREIFALGAEEPVPLDVQVISATHQDLQAMIQTKSFREDLYYRLGAAVVRLPALRERSDKAWLIRTLLEAEQQGAYLQPQALEALLACPWPGNIRQLLNTLRYAVALAENGCIGMDCLPAELTRATRTLPLLQTPEGVAGGSLQARIGDVEGQALLDALRQHKWNVTAASDQFGISRSTLYRKMKKHGIVPPNALG